MLISSSVFFILFINHVMLFLICAKFSCAVLSWIQWILSFNNLTAQVSSVFCKWQFTLLFIKVGEVVKTTQVLKCDCRGCYINLYLDLILKRISESFENHVAHDMKKSMHFCMQILIRQHMCETAGINIILFSSVFRWISAIKSSTAKWPPLHQAIQDYMSRPSEETRMWTRLITGQSGVSQQAQACSNHSMRISSFSLKIRSVNIVTNNNLSYLTVT